MHREAAAGRILWSRGGPRRKVRRMRPLNFGDITVDRLVEAEGPSFFPAFIFPEHDAGALEAERSWIEPRFYDAETGRFVMSLHAYIIRTPYHTILVDTCVGNDKERPSTKPWHHLQTPWLQNLGAMGVAPEAVDFALCTHLHVDHVGWNTRLENGRWVPTFPNATYLFNKTEYARSLSSALAASAKSGSSARDSPPR